LLRNSHPVSIVNGRVYPVQRIGLCYGQPPPVKRSAGSVVIGVHPRNRLALCIPDRAAQIVQWILGRNNPPVGIQNLGSAVPNAIYARDLCSSTYDPVLGTLSTWITMTISKPS
jgi:hypothetical protein